MTNEESRNAGDVVEVREIRNYEPVTEAELQKLFNAAAAVQSLEDAYASTEWEMGQRRKRARGGNVIVPQKLLDDLMAYTDALERFFQVSTELLPDRLLPELLQHREQHATAAERGAASFEAVFVQNLGDEAGKSFRSEEGGKDDDFIDRLPENQRLLCWGYDAEVLTKVFGPAYGDGVKQALMEAFKDLSLARSPKLRGRNFPVWCGDYGPYYCIGIPQRLTWKLAEVLDNRLKKVPGYRFREESSVAASGLIPRFRYDAGRVVIYIDDYSEAGKTGTDGPDGYGTGLPLVRRYAVTE